MKRNIITWLFIFSSLNITAQQNNTYNGIDVNMGNLYRLSNAVSRSISPENFTGAKGEGGKATAGTGSGPQPVVLKIGANDNSSQKVTVTSIAGSRAWIRPAVQLLWPQYAQGTQGTCPSWNYSGYWLNAQQ